MAHKMPPMPALAPGRKVRLAEVVAGAVPPGSSVAVVGRLDATRTTPSSITLTSGGVVLRINTAALSAELLGTLPHDGAVEVIGEVGGRPSGTAMPPGGASHGGAGEESDGTTGDGGGGGGVSVDARVARLLVGYDEDLYARALRMREVFEARYGPDGTVGR
ncbi:hypothetical protein MMPV_004229 [Pyropia vietnamensis]